MPRPCPRSAALDAVGDLLSDLAIWGLATWTVVYHLGRLLGVGTSPLLLVSAVVTLAASMTTWRHVSPPLRAGLDAAGGPSDAVPAAADGPAGRGARWAASWQPFALSAAFTGGALLVHRSAQESTYPVGWALMVAALLPLLWGLVAQRARGTASRHDAVAETSGAPSPTAAAPAGGDGPGAVPVERRLDTLVRVASSAFVWAVGVLLGYLSLRTVRLDADDVFYVNKAVYVAETGRIPVRDTIYSDQVLPALRGAGTAPVQSLEVLQGAVAHVLGLSAGTVVYLVTPAVMSFLAVWAVWRLARSWSAVRALVAFVVAVTYLLWGVLSDYGLGAFWIARIWQGKVIFVCLALPLLYVALTRWARAGRRYDAVLLLAVGTVAVGLTSTATLVVPPIAAGVALLLLLCRRPGWYVPLLAALYPVASGVVVALAASGGGEFGAVAFSSFEAFHKVLGAGVGGALGVTALLLGPWAVRAGGGRITAAAGSVVAVAAMAPGVPQLVNSVTGAGPILYRLMWVAALPVLVGVLATAPLPVERFGRAVTRTAAVVVPASMVVLLVLGGQLLWSRSTTLEDGPRWKYPSGQLAAARWVADSYDGPGTVLAPWRLMRALSLTTTRIHAVDPRAFYLGGIDEAPEAHAARARLSEAMRDGDSTPPPTLAEDLAAVGVGYLCLDARKARLSAAVVDLGWEQVATRAGLACYREDG